MTKKADTWMPFYVGDYLADTMLLSTIQHGAYLLLMLACWKSGGSLPDNDDALAAAARMSPAEWRKHSAILRSFFRAQDGLLFHKRITAELERAQALSEARSLAGKKGGRPQKAKQEETNRFPDAKAEAKQNETPSPSHSDTSLRSVSSAPGCTDGEHAQDPGALAAIDHRAFFAQENPQTDSIDPSSNDSTPTLAGKVCRAIRVKAKFQQVNPGDPRFLALLAQGATEEEFVGMAAEAAQKAKGWGWLLAAVEGRRRDASSIDLRPGNVIAGRAPTAAQLAVMQACPEIASPSLRAGAAAPTPLTIDLEASHAPAKALG